MGTISQKPVGFWPQRLLTHFENFQQLWKGQQLQPQQQQQEHQQLQNRNSRSWNNSNNNYTLAHTPAQHCVVCRSKSWREPKRKQKRIPTILDREISQNNAVSKGRCQRWGNRKHLRKGPATNWENKIMKLRTSQSFKPTYNLPSYHMIFLRERKTIQWVWKG